MQQQWERQPDNPAENRITTWSAITWSTGLVFGLFSSSALAISTKVRAVPAPMIWVLLLTTILSALLLSLVWALRPRRTWAVGRQILWGSVFAVMAAIILSSGLPWYYHWLQNFSR
ncbi:MAG: hypothetical protein ACYCT0_05250 [Sulfobacillus sp.]